MKKTPKKRKNMHPNSLKNIEKNKGRINSTEMARELGRMPEKPSIKKKIAARLRVLKQKGLTEETAHHITAIMEDPDIADFDVLVALQKAKQYAKSAKDINVYSEHMMAWRRIRHGSADRAQTNINTQINTLISDAEKESIVKRLLDEKDD